VSGLPAFDLEAWLAAAPASPPIVQAGDPVLRRGAEAVPSSLFGTVALAQLVSAMVDVMRAAPGVGLAAPQIGVPLRVFVAEDSEDRLAHLPADVLAVRGRTPLPLMALINPTVVAVSEEHATFFEGCLSVRGYGALVRRAASVDVAGADVNGSPISLRLHGWPARIVQHEFDHLDGTLYVDRMIPRSLSCDAELARWGGRPVSDVFRELVDR
jgi:peptide deformylase